MKFYCIILYKADDFVDDGKLCIWYFVFKKSVKQYVIFLLPVNYLGICLGIKAIC